MQAYIHLFQMKLEIKYCVNVQDKLFREKEDQGISVT